MKYAFHRQVANYKPDQIHDFHIGLYLQRSPMLNSVLVSNRCMRPKLTCHMKSLKVMMGPAI